MSDIAIKVDEVSKIYHLYNRQRDRLKDALNLTKKKCYRVLNPTKGEVTVDGRISALLELGAGFNMEYTGIENVYLNGTMIGFTKEEIDERLSDILDFADIGDFVNQPVKTYSSGMFVRLAFAVAINIL